MLFTCIIIKAVDIAPTVGSISPWILYRQSVQYRRGYCTDSRFNIAVDIAPTVGSISLWILHGQSVH